MSSPRLQLGRWSAVGHVYSLTFACHGRRRLFLDARAAQLVMDLFARIDGQGLTHSLAWAVMPDHVHWLLALRARTLGFVVQRFKGRSALLLNRARGDSGPVWQAGYYDHCVRGEESLRGQATYLLANPVRAGLADAVGRYPFAWCRWPVNEERETPSDMEPG